jgi:hypothetical protein
LQQSLRTRKYGKADVGGASIVLKLETLPFVRGQFPLHFEMLDKRSKSLFLIADYGGGADGKVWLACTSSGHFVAVKLSDSRLDKRNVGPDNIGHSDVQPAWKPSHRNHVHFMKSMTVQLAQGVAEPNMEETVRHALKGEYLAAEAIAKMLKDECQATGSRSHLAKR